MRNIRKSSTLESKFPLLAVEQGCIISKEGDITVAYEVTLPEIFTVAYSGGYPFSISGDIRSVPS